MADIDEYDEKLLAGHDLLERFGAGEPLTDEEMSTIAGLPAGQYFPYRERRLQALLHKRQFGLD